MDRGLNIIDTPPAIVKDLPPQIVIKEDEVSLAWVGEKISEFVDTVLVNNFTMSVTVSALLSILWNMSGSLQTMVYLPLMSGRPSATESIFFENYMKIAAFELTPTDGLFEYLFLYQNFEPFNSKFEELGFETHSTSKNLGVLVVMCFILLVGYAIYLPLLCVPTRFKKIGAVRGWF